MTNTQTAILSSNHANCLHHAFFMPKGDIKATLLIVHGMSEHSGRYAKFASFLADNGVLVATYDQLGHGKTAKDKYELGFFDEKHPVQTLCKDVIIMANKTKALAPNVPHFIMGHSMGSFLVRTVLIHHASGFDGAILMGTGNRYGIINHIGELYLGMLNRLQPKKRNLGFAHAMNQYLLSQLRSSISPSQFAWISENTDNVRAFENDPLAGFAFSNNGFFTLSMLMKKACTPAWYAHLPNDFPILLISGKDDPVGNMGQDIDDLCDTLHQAGKTAVKKQLYSNMRHEPLHENNQHRVYDDICHWLFTQISKF